MIIVMLLIAFVALTFIDVPQLKKNKHWRELIIYCVIMGLAFTQAVLHVLDVEIPNPAKDTQYIVAWLFEQINLYYS